MWDLNKIWYKWTYLQNETDSQTFKKPTNKKNLTVAKGETGWGRDKLGVWD